MQSETVIQLEVKSRLVFWLKLELEFGVLGTSSEFTTN